MTTLKEIKPGNIVKVIKMHGSGSTKRKLMDMGVTKGTEIYVRKVAPLGDPIEVKIRGYEFNLRKSEAEVIEVE